MRVQKLDVPVCTLGESPVWSARDACLYYVDIVSHRLHAYSPHTGEHREWPFDTYVGAVAECRSGGLVIALGDRVVRFDPRASGGSIEELVVLERDRPENRLNDGKVDPWGRFWVASIRRDETTAAARLWCITSNGQAHCVREGITVGNSLAFDRSRERMYFADSPTGLIEHAPLGAGGALGDFSPFAKASKGAPDGSTTDAEGYLWNAEWGGHRLCRYTPDGSVSQVLEMPTSRPSACAFGGDDYRTLFVTSANVGMSAEELAEDPLAGSLFSVQVDEGIHGVPADRFAV